MYQSIYFNDVEVVFLLSGGCPHLPRKAILGASGSATRRLSLGCFAFCLECEAWNVEDCSKDSDYC